MNWMENHRFSSGWSLRESKILQATSQKQMNNQKETEYIHILLILFVTIRSVKKRFFFDRSLVCFSLINEPIGWKIEDSPSNSAIFCGTLLLVNNILRHLIHLIKDYLFCKQIEKEKQSKWFKFERKKQDSNLWCLKKHIDLANQRFRPLSHSS